MSTLLAVNDTIGAIQCLMLPTYEAMLVKIPGYYGHLNTNYMGLQRATNESTVALLLFNILWVMRYDYFFPSPCMLWLGTKFIEPLLSFPVD